MRTIPVALQDEINTGRIARLLKITCTNGDVFAFTDSDVHLTVDGVTYEPAPGLSSVRLNATSDNQVSNQRLTASVVDVPEDLILGGVFDEAEVEAAWTSWADPSLGRVVIFKGTFGQISWDETNFEVDVVSASKLLGRVLGWTYTSTCRHKLFGGAEAGRLGYCGLNSASFTFTGTVSAVAVPKWKFGTGLVNPDGYFSAGVLTWTSGNNAGLSSTVKKYASGNIDLYVPTAFAIQAGDTFSIQAGCDKTLETCKTKFNNVNNFGGFPHIQPDVNYR